MARLRDGRVMFNTGGETPVTVLRSERNVPAILAAIGLEVLKQRGEELVCECPQHFARLGKRDKSPSFSVNESTGIFGCWSCQYNGTITTLVTDQTDMNRWDAMRWLSAQGWASVASKYDLELEGQPVLDLSNMVTTTTFDDDFEAFGRPPSAALRSRAIDEDTAEEYDLRWDDEDSWIIPMKNYNSRLVGYQLKRGAYVNNEPEGVKKSETLFGLNLFQVGEPAVILESPLDVCRLATYGLHTGLATWGIEFSRRQVDMMLFYTDRFIVAFDFDSEGKRASHKLYKALKRGVGTSGDVRFFNYRKIGSPGERPKDVGEMTDEQIATGIQYARSYIRAVPRLIGPKPAEETTDVRRGNAKRARHPATARGARRRQDGLRRKGRPRR